MGIRPGCLETSPRQDSRPICNAFSTNVQAEAATTTGSAAETEKTRIRQKETELIIQLIRDTWQSLLMLHSDSTTQTKTALPSDRLAIFEQEIVTYDRTKPTNIGIDLLCFLAAEQLGFLTGDEAEEKIVAILEKLFSMDRVDGFYYDWYTLSGIQMETWPGDEEKKKLDFISSVDNAWLALGLLILKKAKPHLADQIQNEILSMMSFELFFDTIKQEYWGGKWVGSGDFTKNHYARELLSETRIIAIVHAALENDPAKKLEILSRLRDVDGNIPSTFAGGALFELLMVRLFVSEPDYDEVVLALFELHKEYGDKFLDGCIGLSVGDCPNAGNNYKEAGTGGIYDAATWLTSHGMALPLLVDPDRALRTLRIVAEIAGYHGFLGLFDSVDIKTGVFTNTQVFINQAMFFLSLYLFTNDLNFFKNYTDQYFVNP